MCFSGQRIGPFFPEVNRICAISSAEHAKADRAERLQRSESRFAFIWDFAGNLNGGHETLICLNKKPHSYSDPGTLWHIYLNHTHIHTRT